MNSRHGKDAHTGIGDRFKAGTEFSLQSSQAFPTAVLDYRRLRNDLLALALLAVTIFTVLALVSFDPADPPSTMAWPPRDQISNLCGPTGAYVAHCLREAFGLGAWFLVAALFLGDMALFSRSPVPDPFIRGLGIIAMLASVCLALQVLVPRFGPVPVVGSGGYVGAVGSLLLNRHFSLGGTSIVIATIFCVGLLLSTETLFFGMAFQLISAPFVVVMRPFYGSAKPKVTAPKPHKSPIPRTPLPVRPVKIPPGEAELVSEEDDEEIEDDPEPVDEEPVTSAPGEFKVNAPVSMGSMKSLVSRFLGWREPGRGEAVDLPTTDLLEEGEEFPFELLAAKAQVAAATLEKTFEQFGLKVKISEIDTGPVVTLFELELEPGLRVSKVANLQDDIAIALRVPAVRVVSPIPGKNTVGVEVPNDTRVMVRLKELLNCCGDKADKVRIPIYLGKDVSGHPVVVDMTKMPHLLIAGRTGTGKSVCLNTLILSILMTRSPDEVRMLMIDPKMVELSPYTRIPHLMHPVITDMKKAEAVLAWAVDKMEERYDLLAKVGVRHLDSFNKLGKEKILDRLEIDADDPEAEDIPDHMPYIVIIADEMADMIMTSGKEVEASICRLAQKSRAVGIHLVLATQKPTVDVITGLIKSNLPARIAFQVASKTDSRVVLDENGAERLLGNGDMLYLAPGTSTLIRAQGTYVSDDEVNAVIDFYSDFETQYSTEIEQVTAKAATAATTAPDGTRERDPLYAQAVEVVIQEGRGSVSLLQRSLGVGYGRAARMVDHMAEDGIVGDYKGSKSREVVCTLEDWQAMQRTGGFGPVPEDD